MMSRSISWGVVGLVLLMVFCSVGRSEEQTTAARREVIEQPQERATLSSAEPQALQAWSVPWHTYLWESFPSDWLQDNSKAALLEAYQENDWKPFFITAHFDIDPRGRLLLERLARLHDDAIDPGPYQVEDLKYRLARLEALRGSSQASVQKCLDVLVNSPDAVFPTRPAEDEAAADTRAATAPARVASPGSDLERTAKGSCGELLREASAVDIQLASDLIRFANEMNPFTRDLKNQVLLGKYPMDQFLKELEPPALQYQVLLQALRRYQQLAVQGYPQRLVPSQKLSFGDSGQAVRDLQQRLQEEECYQGKITGHFDEATRQAVQRFQTIHNLESDGKVGQQTREWLNVSFETKAELIAQALKLLRQSETRRFQKFVWINIPQFTLEYRNGGKIEAVHRVIVGKAGGKKVKLNGRWVGENQTPTLASNIEQVVFNPRWIVTDRIRQELSDAIAADPTFLARHGYVEMTSSRYRSGEPLLIQMPGPNNALGRVRFDFPNPYAVYMHDTPNRGLFQRSRRDFSHGCIRVDKAHQLAREILADDQNPAASKTDAFLGTNRETYLKLNEPVPIVIEYLPVVVNARGELVFCGDPYGWFPEKAGRKS